MFFVFSNYTGCSRKVKVVIAVELTKRIDMLENREVDDPIMVK